MSVVATIFLGGALALFAAVLADRKAKPSGIYHDSHESFTTVELGRCWTL